MTEKEHQEYFKVKFEEEYYKAFGIKIELEQYNNDQEDGAFIYGVWGVKSPWL